MVWLSRVCEAIPRRGLICVRNAARDRGSRQPGSLHRFQISKNRFLHTLLGSFCVLIPHRPTKLLIEPAACKPLKIHKVASRALASLLITERGNGGNRVGNRAAAEATRATSLRFSLGERAKKSQPIRVGTLSIGGGIRNRTRVRFPKRIAIEAVFVLIFGRLSFCPRERYRLKSDADWFGERRIRHPDCSRLFLAKKNTDISNPSLSAST